MARPHPRLGSVRAAVLSALCVLLTALGLAGCGPGVGGTGTGEEGRGLQAFGAEPRNVCTSELASLLGCVPTGPSAGAGMSAGEPSSAATWWSSNNAAVQLTLRGQAVALQAECGALEFNGLWGQTSAGTTAYYGWLRADGGERPALLAVLRVDTQLVVTLIETDSRVRLGPVATQRSPVAGGLACP